MSRISSMPSVAVIVATRGRPQNLARLVPAVLEDDAVSVMVVVVDGEDPESVAALQALEISHRRLIHRAIPHAGQLGALEVGVSMTDADVLLLLDDDVLPGPGLAAAHGRAHMGEEHLVLVGSMPVQFPPTRPDVASVLYARDYLRHCERLESGASDVLGHLWLGNVSLRRANCVRIGLSSSAFSASYHSDQDLGLRLAEAGLIGRFDPRLAAVHLHRRTNTEFLHDAHRRGSGLAQLHALHESLGPFDEAAFVETLPRGLAGAVVVLGRSRFARPAARALLGIGSVAGRLRWEAGRILLANLARRFMFVRGATTDGALVSPDGAETQDLDDETLRDLGPRDRRYLDPETVSA